MIEPYELKDYIWVGIGDNINRNAYYFSDDSTTHTTLATNDAQTTYGRSLGSMLSVQVSVDTAVVTTALIVQVQVNGRDIYEDALRPTVAVGATDSPIVYVPGKRKFHRGDAIKTIIEQVDGAQTGTLNVVLKQQPYELAPQDDVRAPTPRERFTRHLDLEAPRRGLGGRTKANLGTEASRVPGRPERTRPLPRVGRKGALPYLHGRNR